MIRTPNGDTLIRVDSPEAVVTIAQANRVRYSRTDYAASVTLADGVAYYWTSAA